MRKYVLSKIGNMSIAKEKRDIVLQSGPGRIGLKDLHETTYPTGKRVRQCLARMFSQAIDSGYLGEPKPQNPFTWESMKHVLPKQKHVHETTPRPAVPFEEIREFMQMLRAYRPLKGRPRLDGIQHRA